MIFKYLVYRATPEIGGGELEAGFINKTDAETYCKNKAAETGKDYYVKEV